MEDITYIEKEILSNSDKYHWPGHMSPEREEINANRKTSILKVFFFVCYYLLFVSHVPHATYLIAAQVAATLGTVTVTVPARVIVCPGSRPACTSSLGVTYTGNGEWVRPCTDTISDRKSVV